MTGPCLVSEDWSGSLEAEQEQPLDPGSELFLLLGLDPSEPWPLSPLDRELQHTALIYTATISGQNIRIPQHRALARSSINDLCWCVFMFNYPSLQLVLNN